MQELHLSLAQRPLPTPRDGTLWVKAKEFEACFLAEMLAHARLGAQESGLGGGIGEGQFGSFLHQEQARLLVEKGGIGLAARIYGAMERAGNG